MPTLMTAGPYRFFIVMRDCDERPHVEWPSIDEHVGVWTLLGGPEDEVLEAAGLTMTPRAAPT